MVFCPFVEVKLKPCLGGVFETRSAGAFSEPFEFWLISFLVCFCSYFSSCFWPGLATSFQVLHLRDQLHAGLGLADKWMEKRCLMLCQDKSDSLTGFARRVLTEASQRFPDVQLEKMHHIGILDLTKYGRLSMPEIDSCANWAHKVLSMNPDYSFLHVIKNNIHLDWFPQSMPPILLSPKKKVLHYPRHGADDLPYSGW